MEPIVLISLLFNAIAVLLVVWLVYKGGEALSEFRPYIKEVAELKKEMLVKSNEIIAASTEMANQIVQNARLTSEKNIETTNGLLRQMQEQLSQGVGQTLSETKLNIQTSTKSNLEIFEKQLLELNEELARHSEEIKRRLLEESGQRLDQLASDLPKELLEVEKEAEHTITAKLGNIDAQVEEERKKRLALLDEKIYLAVAEVAKRTLGRSIDVSSHEELVRAALEKAKKEELFKA